MFTKDELRAVIFLAAVAAAGGVIRALRPAPTAADTSAVAPEIRGGDIAAQAARSLRAERLAQPLQPGERVAVNRAQADELDRLPGIGPALARRIIDHRNAHGPFRQVNDLEAVPGIGPALLRRLAPHLAVP